VATDEPKPLIAPAPTRDAAQPAAVAPLPDPRQELEQAARRLRAGDADARAAGRAMLQRLRREHFGSALAEQAWDLLLADRQAEQHQEPAPGPNAEITRLTAKVATLTSLAAAALADVLSDLFHPSVPAAPADAEAVQALRRDALQRVERLLAGADDEAGPVAPELCAIIEATVHRHRDFAGALRPALDARELAVGEHRLAQAEASIAAALAQADPDAAAAAFLALRHLDLAGWADLDETLESLSALADTCVQRALDLLTAWTEAELGVPRDAAGHRQRLLVLGMGKLGARELNMSSDIDLIFAFPHTGSTVGGPRELTCEQFFTRLGQRLVQALDQVTADGFVFRVDTRLRPFGSAGPLAMSFDAMEGYYHSQAREWERYASAAGCADAGPTGPAQGNCGRSGGAGRLVKGSPHCL